jgi:uncharacterized protein (TIGR03437 family)
VKRSLLPAFLLCVCALSAQGIITTLAGSTPGFHTQPPNALNASFGAPQSVAFNGTLLYFADSVQNVVYSVDGNENLTALAGLGFAGYSGDGGTAPKALLNNPTSVAFDSVSGDLYIADSGNNRIRRILGNGNIATYAGSSFSGYSGDGGAATSAGLSYPTALTFDASGNLYFSDGGSRVRMVSTSGTITTVAGGPNFGYSGDGGPATAATFNNIGGLVFDNTKQYLYVSDNGNNVIRRVQVGGTVTTVVGNGSSGYSGDGGPAQSAQLNSPQGLATDGNGNVYIADTGNNVIRFVSAGTISTVAGVGGIGLGYTGDGEPATSAGLNNPYAVVSATGSGGKAQIFIADAGDGRIRNVKIGGAISTVAGNGQFNYGGDGGPATSALMAFPFAVNTDSSGNMYIADLQNNRVRMVSTTGTITTIAGNGTPSSTGDGGPASAATVFFPSGVVVDSSGNLYVSELGSSKIRKINAGGTISTIAGTGTPGFSGDGGPATSAMLNFPAFVTLDTAGNLYFADYLNYRIRKITTGGVISTVAGNGQSAYSGDNGPATSAGMQPGGVFITSSGVLYIADDANQRIRTVSAAGIITTLASLAPLQAYPMGLTVTAAGNALGCFKTASGNSGIGMITPGGAISLYAGGQPKGFAGDGGPATAAAMSCQSVSLDNSGNLLVADAGNNRIRKVFTAAPTITPGSTTLNFTATEGALPVPQTVNVTGTTGAIVQTSATTASGTWTLGVSPGFGLLPAPVIVAPFSANLGPGNYQGTVTLQIGGVTSTIQVNLTVNAPAGAGQLTVSPSSVVATAGNGNTESLVVSVSGSGSVGFTATTTVFNGSNGNQGWLSVSPSSGTASLLIPAAFTLTFNAGALLPGVYTGQVAVTGGGSTVTTPVRLIVPISGSPVMVLNHTGLNILASAGAGIIPRSVIVHNAGSGSLSWTASVVNGGSWLSLSGASGNSPAQGASSVVVLANTAGLSPGVYYGLIEIASSQPNAVNAPQYVTAVLRVVTTTPAGNGVYPQGVILVAQGGGFAQQTVDVSTASAAPVQVAAAGQVPSSAPSNWLTVSSPNNGNPTSATSVTAAPDAQLQIGANAGSLSPGVYNGLVTATYLDGSKAEDIRVSLIVPNIASGSCTPTRLILVMRQPGPNFPFTQGWPAPLEAQLYNDCGQPVPGATVTANFSNGDPPLVLTSAGGGIYAGMWKPGTPGPVSIMVTYCNSCTAPPVTPLNGNVAAAPAGVPSIGLGGVVNGASFAPGADIAPGSIVSAFGVNLATSNGNQNGGFPLPTTLAGIKLTIGGIDAPLFYSGTGQVNAQLPFEIPVGWQTQVVARATGSGTEIDAVPEVVTVSAAHPGIFIAAEGGAPNQGAILNPANQVVDATNPSSVGQVIVIFATGLGQATPALATGAAAGAGAVNNTVSATIGGVPVPAVNIQYAGPAPGFVGLYQVNIQIPTGVAAGNTVPVVLTQNGINSNAATIAVH